MAHEKQKFHVEQTQEYFTNARGEVLRRWSLPDAPSSPKAVCILVHGILEHAAAYEQVAVTMQKSYGIALYSYDQVGHGKSEGPRVDISDFQHYVDDLMQFVDIIKDEHPKLPLFIMGHAFGGLVLGYAMLRSTDLCKGAIMYSPLIQPSHNFVFSEWATNFFSRFIPSFPVGCFEAEKLTTVENEIEVMKKDPLRYQGGLKARWAKGVIDSANNFQTKMKEIGASMYIAHGANDNFCMVEGAQKLHDEVQSKDKSIKIYEHLGHRLHSERGEVKQQFVEDVCQWIESRV